MCSIYPSAHPFKFSTTSDGTHNSGTEYTTGVTHNESSTQVTIVVATDAPTLYYYCSSHSGMGGQANTPVPAVNSVELLRLIKVQTTFLKVNTPTLMKVYLVRVALSSQSLMAN